MPAVGFAIDLLGKVMEVQHSQLFSYEKNHEFILALTAEVMTKELADKTPFICKKI